MEEIIVLKNDRFKIEITNYGARVMRWLVDGVDIVLGFDHIDQYKSAIEPYHSAIIGRYANRIANAQFTLNNESFRLNNNLGNHILHGGSKAFHNSIWTVQSRSENHLELLNLSPNGDQGFPGELTTKAIYTLEADGLLLEVKARTTKSTPVNITHHPYFNLSGLESSDLSHHQFLVHSNEILETNHEGIPSGNRVQVANNGFDFTNWKSLAKGINESHAQIELLNGIDHTYITDQNDQLKLQAEARAIDSHIHMQVYSNQPGIQFYTANHFEEKETGKSGRRHAFRGAFCFEPQKWPDGPNQNNFPDTILQPNEQYNFSLKYKFPLLEQDLK